MYGQTQRLEGSQTSPHRLDSGRLRRAGRFGAHLVTLATFVITLIQPKRAKSGGSPGTSARVAALSAACGTRAEEEQRSA